MGESSERPGSSPAQPSSAARPSSAAGNLGRGFPVQDRPVSAGHIRAGPAPAGVMSSAPAAHVDPVCTAWDDLDAATLATPKALVPEGSSQGGYDQPLGSLEEGRGRE